MFHGDRRPFLVETTMSPCRNTPKLETLLAGVQLPALPQSAIRILELSQDPDNGPAEYAVPIESDPGLAGQVLRFVNSSYFGFSREISSIKLAITLVGVRTIRNFTLWSAVFSLMPNPRCGMFDLKSLWQDSLRRALFARLLARQLGLEEAEDLFTAGLLQDMAIPLLAKELPEHYRRFFEERAARSVRLSALEREQFGWTHADAAALLARNWALPKHFGNLMEAHICLDQLLAEPAARYPELVIALSALLPAGQDEGWPERRAFLAAYARISGGGPGGVRALLADVDTGFEEFAPVMQLGTPPISLAQRFSTAHEFTARS